MVVQFNQFIPVIVVDVGAAIVVVILGLGLVYKIRRSLKVVPPGLFRDARTHMKSSGMLRLLLAELAGRVLAQKDILTDSRTRRITHLLVFWGFLGLALATVWDDIFFNQGTLPSPFSVDNFGNIVGNIGGALVLAGMTVIILRYLTVDRFKDSWKGDMVFLSTLYVATLTGFAAEVTRFSSDSFAFANYAVHLTFVAVLIAAAPFTHFFHAMLTPIMRYVGRIQDILASKGVSKYPYYKKLAMVDLAEDVRSDKTNPLYPQWLREKEKDANSGTG